MPFQYMQGAYRVADESANTTISEVSTGVGTDMRMIFEYRDPDASFYFFAKPYSGDEGRGWQLKEAWSLDGVAREDRVDLRPKKLSSDLTLRAFTRIVEALPEFPLADPKLPGTRKRLKEVRFDLHGSRTHNPLSGGRFCGQGTVR